MVGARTKIVTRVGVSGWTANDTTYFVPLVERTAENFQIREVSADRAYLSRKNLKAVERAGGTPYVPFKPNTVPPDEDSIGSKMYSVFMLNRETFLQHYHKRSSAESAFSMVKAKFGDSLRSKSYTARLTRRCAKSCVTTSLSSATRCTGWLRSLTRATNFSRPVAAQIYYGKEVPE
jgi:transposase